MALSAILSCMVALAIVGLFYYAVGKKTALKATVNSRGFRIELEPRDEKGGDSAAHR